MSDLQHQVHEQSVTNSTWKYKLGFTCEKCEMKWEVEHQIKDNNGKETGSDEFLDSPFTQVIPKCNCAVKNTNGAESIQDISQNK